MHWTSKICNRCFSQFKFKIDHISFTFTWLKNSQFVQRIRLDVLLLFVDFGIVFDSMYLKEKFIDTLFKIDKYF